MERLAILEDRNASELLILAQSGYQISLWKLGILKRIKKHVQNNFHMMNSSWNELRRKKDEKWIAHNFDVNKYNRCKHFVFVWKA